MNQSDSSAYDVISSWAVCYDVQWFETYSAFEKNVIYFIWCIDSGSRTMFNELNKHYFGGKFVYAITFWMPNFF